MTLYVYLAYLAITKETSAAAAGTPFGALPILEMEGGVKLCANYAIARYLARKFGKC